MHLCPCAEALRCLGEHLDNVDPRQASDGLWGPPVEWTRLHGDGKSLTGGLFHTETMGATNGNSQAKVIDPHREHSSYKAIYEC